MTDRNQTTTVEMRVPATTLREFVAHCRLYGLDPQAALTQLLTEDLAAVSAESRARDLGGSLTEYLRAT